MVFSRAACWLEGTMIRERPTTGIRIVHKRCLRSQTLFAKVFFDLEKAYDTAWNTGILSDLNSIGVLRHMM